MNIIRGVPSEPQEPNQIRYARAAEFDFETLVEGLQSGEIREWRSDGEEMWLQVVPPEMAGSVIHGVTPMFASDDVDDILADDDEGDDDSSYDDSNEEADDDV